MEPTFSVFEQFGKFWRLVDARVISCECTYIVACMCKIYFCKDVRWATLGHQAGQEHQKLLLNFAPEQICSRVVYSAN